MADDDKREQFSMRAPPGFLPALDSLRKLEADLPSRTEMLRRLVERASMPKAAARDDVSAKAGLRLRETPGSTLASARASSPSRLPKPKSK
jgi:hypothetical protein